MRGYSQIMSNVNQRPNWPEGSGYSAEKSAIDTVISGQKRLVKSLIGYLCSFPVLGISNVFLGGTPEKPVVTTAFFVVLGIGFLMLYAAAISACTGIFRMGRVLYPGLSRYLYSIGILLPIPFVSLLVMFAANSNATGYLRANGISVGFLGAKR